MHHNTVEKIRTTLTGDLSSDRTYTTRHGTVATMNTANIGRLYLPGGCRCLLTYTLVSIMMVIRMRYVREATHI